MATFKDWVAETKKTPDDIGAEIGVTGQTVRNWLNGEGSPRVQHALKIQELSKGKVPVSVWARSA
jgi:predicted transcriptional regulator